MIDQEGYIFLSLLKFTDHLCKYGMSSPYPSQRACHTHIYSKAGDPGDFLAFYLKIDPFDGIQLPHRKREMQVPVNRR